MLARFATAGFARNHLHRRLPTVGLLVRRPDPRFPPERLLSKPSTGRLGAVAWWANGFLFAHADKLTWCMMGGMIVFWFPVFVPLG